jgi:hypothetical protein
MDQNQKKGLCFYHIDISCHILVERQSGGDGSVRVVGHSSAMDAPSTTSAASAIALSDKDVHNVNKSSNDGSGLLLSSSASCY